MSDYNVYTWWASCTRGGGRGCRQGQGQGAAAAGVAGARLLEGAAALVAKGGLAVGGWQPTADGQPRSAWLGSWLPGPGPPLVPAQARCSSGLAASSCAPATSRDPAAPDGSGTHRCRLPPPAPPHPAAAPRARAQRGVAPPQAQGHRAGGQHGVHGRGQAVELHGQGEARAVQQGLRRAGAGDPRALLASRAGGGGGRRLRLLLRPACVSTGC
jgi:hypothetical protein